ncbi:hypothetical protein B296_00008614, partial [Ensete ventricosum]
AYIVGIVDHLYLATRLPLWLTLPSYTSIMPVILAASKFAFVFLLVSGLPAMAVEGGESSRTRAFSEGKQGRGGGSGER